MKAEKPTPPSQPGVETPRPETPPASLTAVRISPRAKLLEGARSGDLAKRPAANPGAAAPKPGDLTQRLAGAAEPTPPKGPAEPASAAPAATEPARQEPAPATAETPAAARKDAAARPPRFAALDEEAVRRLLDPPERRAANPAPRAPAEAASQSVEPVSPAPAPEPPPLTLTAPIRDEPPPPPPPPELRLVVEALEAEKAQMQDRDAAASTPAITEPPPPAAPAAAKPAAPAPAAAPRPAATPVLAETELAASNSIDAVVDYWDGLRGDEAVPKLDRLDRDLISRSWPDTLLVAYDPAEAVPPRLTRLGEPSPEIEYSQMVLDWIMSRGRTAARRGEPMEEEKRFPAAGTTARYQLVLLPLAGSTGRSEYVLCHLVRAKEAAARGVFKRWLAS